jgi:hypothetical protein
LGTPANFLGTPASLLGTPANFLGTPANFLGTPANFLGTPASLLGTPALFLWKAEGCAILFSIGASLALYRALCYYRYMKKLLLCVLVTFAALSAFCKTGDVLYVGIKEVKLKDGTGFFARKTFTVYYGDVAVVVGEKGSWTQIQIQGNSSVRGWIASSSLTKKKIITGNSASTTTQELALAGKGFSPEAEKTFKSDNPEKRYDLVDRIEQNSVSEDKLQAFLANGKLNGGIQ